MEKGGGGDLGRLGLCCDVASFAFERPDVALSTESVMELGGRSCCCSVCACMRA